MNEERMWSFGEAVLEEASRHAEQAEVFLLLRDEMPVSFESNRLKSVERRVTRGLALRLIHNGRVGFTSTTRLENPAAIVQAALEVAPFGTEVHFSFPSALQEEKELRLYTPEVGEIPAEKLVDMGQQALDHVLHALDGILCDVSVERYVSEVGILNSQGLRASYHKGLVFLSVHVNRVQETDMLDVYESAIGIEALPDVEAVAEEVVTKVRMAERIASIREGSYPVIFTPKGFHSTLFLPLSLAFNGKYVLEGASALVGKVGEECFDPRFSLYDDGALPGGVASAPVDDEGVPTQRTSLVEQGVVKGFFYDLQTAARAGTSSTGNGGRALTSMPQPETSNWVIPPGDTPFEKMIEGIEEGLIVDQTMGAWAGNLMAGEFSGNVHLGYKIEGGKVVGRVKDTMIAGNVFKALKDVRAIGDRPRWTHALHVPAIAFESLSVASKG